LTNNGEKPVILSLLVQVYCQQGLI